MAYEIVFLHSLKPGVDQDAYEDWVKEVDYPRTRRQPGVISYAVTRLGEATDGAEAVPYQYLEVITVEDPVAYQRNLKESSDEEFLAMLSEWGDYVERYVGSVGVPVD